MHQVHHTVQSSSTGSIDNTAEFLFPEMGPSCLGARESAFQMDFHNLIPLLVGHVLKPEQLLSISRERLCRTFTPYPAESQHC
jgi:hypothetical protein